MSSFPRRIGISVLAVVAVAGAVLSWDSLYHAAVPTFGPVLAALFPALVDLLILGAGLLYAAGVRDGRPVAGWRLVAHTGVALTVGLNALAAPDLASVPWHVTAPIVWSVLVELARVELAGERRARIRGEVEPLPARLWLSAPVESVRTWLSMARTGRTDHAAARVDLGRREAAEEALRLATGGRVRPRRVRAVLARQLRQGTLTPADVADALAPTEAGSRDGVSADDALRRALAVALARPAPKAAPAPRPTPKAAAAPRPAGSEQARDLIHAHRDRTGAWPAGPDLPTLAAATGLSEQQVRERVKRARRTERERTAA